MPAPFPTRGRPRSDLHDFCRWLKENRGIAPNTVNVYASQVRAILRLTNQPPRDVADCDGEHQPHPEQPAPGRHRMLTATTR